VQSDFPRDPGRLHAGSAAGEARPLQEFRDMSAALRALALALACAVAAVPLAARAGMGFGNAAPVVAVPTFSADPVPADATVTVTCSAQDTDGTVTALSVTVTGGTLENGAGTQALPIVPAASVTASVGWTTPAAPGPFTVTCSATDSGGAFGVPPSTTVASATVTTVVTERPPVVRIVKSPTAAVVAGATIELLAEGTDPQGGTLGWTWTVDGGALVFDGPAATWTAPQRGGAYVITATAANAASLTGAASVSADVVLAGFQGSLAAELVAPMRVAAGPAGELYAIDARGGRLALLTPRGELKGVALLDGQAVSVAYGPDVLLVATADGRLLEVDPATGRGLREIPLADGPLASPVGLAWEPTRMRVWIAERAAGQVRVVGLDGATAFRLAQSGAAPLRAPVDVAADGAGRVLVALEKAAGESDVLPGDPPELRHVVHAFDVDGARVGSFLLAGGRSGEVTRTGGLAARPGRVLVSDIYQSRVVVTDAAGAPLGSLGAFGFDAGQLRNPAGVAALAGGAIAVANSDAGRIERFTSDGAPLPECEGDRDCDGLPDAWEIANGLSPTYAGDALVDGDGDGLLALEEHGRSTDPNRADTDADGVKDLDEIVAGQNPTDPSDHLPVLASSDPAPQGPGLARWSATVSGVGDCAASWTQTGGPRVTLSGAGTLSPSFVARAAGAYRFQGVPVCSGLTGAAAAVTVTIDNVAPRADAGGIVVVQSGKTVALSGAGSSDANGDALALGWDQVLGPPALGSTAGGSAAVRVLQPGYYVFRLAATDPKGAVGEAEQPVLVVAEGGPTAVVSTPLQVDVGARVALDASGSYRSSRATFAWTQLDGPPAALAAAGDRAAFDATQAGRYVFQVTVVDGPFRSPPARIEVYVAETNVAFPVARASAPAVAAVNFPVTLDGGASTGDHGLGYAWRQLSGPAAGLTHADRATATVVPFAAGSYVFELSVSDGATPGLPARVRLEAREGGRAIPVAAATGPGTAAVGQLVLLDGRASTGAVRWRWTQTAGPWVPLSGDRSTPTFRAAEAGLYSFDLEVEDGTVRSAPAAVHVLVVPDPGIAP
jgi:hypothetical protein